MKYNENLKKIRNELGLSQKEFAKVLGYNYRSISNWETGVRLPSIFVFQRIRKRFKIDLEDLFDFDEEE
ncbi:MAG: helix-turn-helix domain-containing protein [Clostridia bacterium]|nr:helix-turn-helix domain-containing protein [Clostridia bacterium]